MSTVPTDPDVASPEVQAPARRPTLQQRFEESRVGRRVITGIILVIIGTQVVWSMPESAIRQALIPVVEPASAIGVNNRWTMFAPDVVTRVSWFKVEVTMADGTSRIWKVNPKPWLERIFLPDRWPALTETTQRQQDGRKEFARWVVDKVTGPGDRPVKVVMSFDFTVLAPPGQPSKAAISNKVLYEENLTGRP